MLWTLSSFVACTAIVGVIAYYRTRRENLKESDGYFLAGRGLTGWVIGASLLLTNLSAEHLVGLNGQSYKGNLTSMAWETTPVVATIVLALYFPPRYLRGAFTTLPEFFGERYDQRTRQLMSALVMLIPGVIAFHMYGTGLAKADFAYPRLVADVFPAALLGFFTAVLFGAVLSTYNSVLNSAATLFCHDIYKPVFKPGIGDADFIRVGKRMGTLVALVTMFVAPFVAYAPEGLFQFVRRSPGFFSIPMITLVLVGFFTKWTSGLAARVAVVFYIVVYTIVVFMLGEPINFIHTLGLLFLGMTAIMLTISRLVPRDAPYQPIHHVRAVDLTPWRYGRPFAFVLFALLLFVYLLCPPIGIASPDGPGTAFAVCTGLLFAAAVALAAFFLSRKAPPGQTRLDHVDHTEPHAEA